MKSLLSYAMRIWLKIELWHRRINESPLYRYLRIGTVCFAGVLSIFLTQAFLEGTWQAKLREGLSRHVSELGASVLPVPFVFLLWVYCVEKLRGPFTLNYSPFFSLISIGSFTSLYMIDTQAGLAYRMLWLAVITSFFTMIPVTQFFDRLWREPRVTLVALIGGTAAYNYYWLLRDIWHYMCSWTTQTVVMILKFFNFDADANVVGQDEMRFRIASDQFSIIVNPGCSGLEGIFLFMFMLSLTLLSDWEFFRRRSLSMFYAFGVVYMFFINTLRITVFYTLGYWAYKPDMPEWVQSMRGSTVDLFHSYVGWVFYVVAFIIFLLWIYESTAEKANAEKRAQTPVT